MMPQDDDLEHPHPNVVPLDAEDLLYSARWRKSDPGRRHARHVSPHY
jgi:hypothetical protein